MTNLLKDCKVLIITPRDNLFYVQVMFPVLIFIVSLPYLQNLFVIKESEKSSKTEGMLTVRNAENFTFSRSILIRSEERRVVRQCSKKMNKYDYRDDAIQYIRAEVHYVLSMKYVGHVLV